MQPAVDGVLVALADPTRLRPLDLLAARVPAATILAAGLPVSRRAWSRPGPVGREVC